MKLWAYAKLEWFFLRLQYWAQEKSLRFGYCRDCGRNRYYGKPCK